MKLVVRAMRTKVTDLRALARELVLKPKDTNQRFCVLNRAFSDCLRQFFRRIRHGLDILVLFRETAARCDLVGGAYFDVKQGDAFGRATWRDIEVTS
jgi:hypothetical protein